MKNTFAIIAVLSGSMLVSLNLRAQNYADKKAPDGKPVLATAPSNKVSVKSEIPAVPLPLLAPGTDNKLQQDKAPAAITPAYKTEPNTNDLPGGAIIKTEYPQPPKAVLHTTVQTSAPAAKENVNPPVKPAPQVQTIQEKNN